VCLIEAGHGTKVSLADDLRADFPSLYESALSIVAPEGWRRILFDLSRRIESLPVTILQVKPKFGGLRFYFRSDDAEVRNAVIAAEWT
jgi:hypothetical protein